MYDTFAKHGRLSKDTLRLFYLTHFLSQPGETVSDAIMSEFVSSPVTSLYYWVGQYSLYPEDKERLDALIRSVERFGRALR